MLKETLDIEPTYLPMICYPINDQIHIMVDSGGNKITKGIL